MSSIEFSDEQEALLALMLAQEGFEAAATQSIPRRAQGLPPALSFAQRRLWFLDQMAPGSAFYNIADAIRIRGVLDVAAFERALNEIVRRHEILRTNFFSSAGEPGQVIAQSRQLVLKRINLQHNPEARRPLEAARLTREEARRPFDLAQDMLLRTTLLQSGPTDYLLLVTMHHIVSDGWSEGVFIEELLALYSAFTQAKPSPLPELPIQYADFAQWQRSFLQGERRTELVAYWKQQLAGLSPLELPLDHPRPAYPSYNGTLLSWQLPRSLVNDLKALSRQEEVTLFMTLLAAFQTVLARHCGQNDIAVGSPIANRTRTELEALIGFFANTLVLRTDLSG
ncbi:MAG TPA: condensation domain-containing protein, partial [Ktedonobacteraceae bacterium]